MARIHLSPPDVGEAERELILAAFRLELDRSPRPPRRLLRGGIRERVHDVADAVALSSGTAALHLALLLLGVGAGDDVIVPTLTFVATANAVRYVGAQPVFVDADETSWGLDPGLLDEELTERARRGRLPRAVIGVDLYGQCADWARITETCARYEVPTVEDAAEALGATCCRQPAGTLADIGTFSFNGNKIVTTSGGGMLIARRREHAARARHLASQAREPFPHYEHTELGFNYRLSNLLGGLGIAQLRRLPAMVARRRTINRRYRERLDDVPGIGFMPTAPYGEPSCWLTVATIDEQQLGVPRDDLAAHLARLDIEARPAWKPMHLQPLYAGAQIRGGPVAERIFRTGLCLPSGSTLTDDDVARVVQGVWAAIGSPGRRE